MFKGRVYFFPRKVYRPALVAVLIMILCGLTLAGPGGEQEVISYALVNKVIVVDPGHGGIDPGANRGEYVEKDITLAIAKKLADKLSQAGAMVVLLRTTDTDLVEEGFSGTIAARKRQDLNNRVKKANDAKADLYISIHSNADPSPRWSGAQTFYNKSSKESKLLAVCIQDKITETLANTKRKAAPGQYYILEQTTMPAVIVEVGFVSNVAEAKNLVDVKYQERMAQAIFLGIAQAQNQEYDQYIEEYPGW